MSTRAGHEVPPAVPGADRIREISLAAWASNRRRAAALSELVGRADLLQNEADRSEARAITHQLIGSAGTFGHDRVSETAREVSDLLNRSEPAETDQPRLVELLATITADLEQEPELDL